MAAKPGAGGTIRSRCPQTIHVLGRRHPQENADVCGEYKRVGQNQGYEIYQMPNQTTMVRYDPCAGRWIIDRYGGCRGSGSCVAYAQDTSRQAHPVNPNLIWHVWSAVEGAFMLDPGLLLVDSPPTVTLVGRHDPQTSQVNGRYHLADVDHGKPIYTREMEDGSKLYIRYAPHTGTWLVSPTLEGELRICCAVALGAPHPGFPGLEWHFLDCQGKAWIPDPAVHTLAAPWMVHVIGRAQQAPNSKINGTYQLVGASDGRPVYVKPGTRSVIRYSEKHDWWLIDADGLQEPSLVTRLYQWILNGDPSAAENQCSAFCRAKGTDHPGYCILEWSVWEEANGRHVPDAAVRVTDAPALLKVSGRHSGRQHSNINGSYFMSGTINGRPRYIQQKAQFSLSLFWSMRLGRWVLSSTSQDKDTVAFSDVDLNVDCPARSQAQSIWSIYERARGIYIPDNNVCITVDPQGSQCPLPDPSISMGELGPCVGRLDVNNSAPIAKRRRLGSDTAEFYDHPADAPMGSQRSVPSITSRIAGLLGG
mmetsp:Transcript_13764/g.27171  ORF Transcript_13764/g.27171 Transcript_13764/m.27171 type:complete len:534 (+) Transcript_13764:81-1682(+)